MEKFVNELYEISSDEDLKKKELELKYLEICLHRDELESNKWKNPLVVGLVVAVIGLVGNVWIRYEQSNNTLLVEKEKLKSNLILESIKTGNQKDASKNLNFLLKLGFLEDPGDKIKKYLSEDKNVPVLPSGMSTYNPGNFEERVKSGIFDNRVGRIKVINKSSYKTVVTLYHPDAPSRFFSKQTIDKNSEAFLGEHSYGNDWGIQIDDSKIFYVGKISKWNQDTNIFELTHE